ncbi:PASTA domain-containing protein [Blastococcus mobilis]|nr:PASTA domain-containing protein [Blastococcus mobilis]
MPDVVGQRLDDALQTLKNAGFANVDADAVFGGLFIVNDDRWAVTEQQPAAGAPVDLDEAVELGAGPLDDARTLEALPSAAVRPELEARRDAERAAKEADAERAAAEAATEAAAELVEPAIFDLPEVYAADHGEDAYDRPRPRVLRRDLAEYLAAVRIADPATADQIAPGLRVVPAAWCSLWLPRHTGEELDRWTAAADASAAHMAAALNVSYASSTTPAIAALMATAREEAGRRFCPEQAAHPGEQVDESPQGAGVFPGEGESPVRMTETVLDSWWFFQSIFGYDQAVPADRIRLAYLSLLAQPAQFRWQEAVLMDCDFYARSLSGELRDNTVETMLTNNTVIEIHDRVDMERAVIREEGHHFDALAGSFIQDC